MADNLPTFTGTEADILATKPASLELGQLQAHERFANLFWQLDKAGNMLYLVNDPPCGQVWPSNVGNCPEC